MTVEKLIEELKAYPPDAQVMVPANVTPYYGFTSIVRNEGDFTTIVIIE